ncbi:SIS domain-containing protein [Eisenbergiella tayi]|uniref:SIS domain-containing protein n=1 Tax=Eisenbergiella tayi TaxID=1432052 RepID=UPI00084935E9|nr:SIS domain-containing protein [Eisenbergiella tayi]ODR35238.1 phosphoheptose isomerase [Eisenbergiella tayi]
MNYQSKLKDYINEEILILQSLDLDTVNEVMNVLEDARLTGKKIFVCGNGGSAATASHYCCDFNKGISEIQNKKYNFECLSDNVPTMMAVANDIGYEEVFRFPLKNKMKAEDIFIGISGSGNSKNVVNAMEYAKSIGGTTIAIVGYDGGKIKQMADHNIHVNINNMQILEDVHMILDHLMMYVLSH